MDDEEDESLSDTGTETPKEEGGEEFQGEQEVWEGVEEEEAAEEEEEQVEVVEEEEQEEEEVYFDTNDYISKPYLSRNCTIPEDIIEFDYSYGYDCQRLFNLSVLDKEILIFASGSMIHFFNTSTKKKWYRRCYSGRGIGHITISPTEPHIAVGEKGENPHIIIYEWPSFEIVTVLKGGTKTEYTFLNYSPDGELLASQGGHPDYMLTIWNWRKHRILIRSRAYGQRVFNSRFSLFVPGHLTSSGISHIKFWKINRTFTGLKLLGELGRFGKSEICNIIGFVALPDEKVLSGCEWGNILVWEAGLIKVEVFKRGKNFCHDAPITQFIYNNNDLTTIAMDGTIKVWYYESIELADPPEEEKFIEIEPIYEYEVGDYYHKAKLLVIRKSDPDNPTDNTWFAQDGNGGIWKLNLSTSLSATHTQILHCHAGKVSSIQSSPFSPHLASLGEDGRFFIYDYKQQMMIMKKEFLAGGCSLLWLPLAVEDSGCVLVGGFKDGVIRVICVSLHEYARRAASPTEDYVNLIQASKPHTKAVTVVTVNPKNTILVTGSEDSTVFVYQIIPGPQFIRLVPIGFVPVTGEVTYCTWKPKRDATLLVACKNGTFCEIELPQEAEKEDMLSFLLQNVNIHKNTFVSVKSEIKRNIEMARIQEERQRILDERREELEQKEQESGVPIDIEVAIEALREEMEAEELQLPEIFIPKIPSSILFATYVGKTIWLSMSGYDAGYMYEYNFQTNGPVSVKMIADADDLEIPCHHYYHNNKYLILGMDDGQIRVVRVNQTDPSDLSDYWSLPMHDCSYGTINQICFNYNYSYMFSCGNDGNLFSYKFTPENYDYKAVNIDNVVQKGFVRKNFRKKPAEISSDIDDLAALSLEEIKNRIEFEEKMKEANAHKIAMSEILKGLEKKFDAMLRRNAKLPKSQQIEASEFTLDERIQEDLNKYLKEEMDLVKFKLDWQLQKAIIEYNKVNNYFLEPVETHVIRVSGISNKEIYAETFRLKKLGPEFEQLKKLVLIKMEEQEAKGRTQARLYSEEEVVETITRRPNPAESLIKQIMALCGDYKKNIKLRRLLRKYKERKDRLESRRIEWYNMMKNKPIPDKPDPEDLASIESAKDTLGDYKLKSAPDYKVPKTAKVTTVNVYNELLKTRERIHQVLMNYNQEVLNLRQKKLDMIEKHQQLREVLLEIAKEIPKEKIRYPPNLPTYTEETEYPEKKFEYTRKGLFDELPKRYKNLYKEEVVKKKEVKLLEREYEMLIFEKKGQRLGKVQSKLALMKHSGITGSADLKELIEAGKDDQVITPWEKELMKLRVVKRLHEQDQIIDGMDKSIKEFDEEIIRLKELRYKVEVDVKFLELYLLTLHQEVLILKKFEAAEEEKENKLFEKLREKHQIQKKMNEINNRVEVRNRDIRRYEEEIKNLIATFHVATSDNKFYDFLRRIFKKKYKPPKVKTDDSDSDSESESSSSSSEEDAKSLDSKDLGAIRLDETVCPPGCDPQLYEWTFEQRSARHTLELNILEEKRQIELHKKEYEALLKKIKFVESQYQACNEDLEEYMREKQRNLNEVETVVLLRLNQIQNFKSESELEKISDSIVFSASGLSNLYKRVGELEKEINAEKQRHEKNRQHLTRMKIDVNHMKDMIIKLTNDINHGMIRKFGMKVDIDDIEESMLKRLVAEMHGLVMESERSFEKKLKVLYDEYAEKENEYAKKLQENTDRYNLLTVLQEEKLRIQETLKRQDKLMCQERPEDPDVDLEKLQKVAKIQEAKIKELRNEIAMLKLKIKPKPPGGGDNFPEIFRRLMIKTCDGELEEIGADVRDEIRDMYEEAQEIVKDAKDGEQCKEDTERMRALAMDMINKLPMKCKEGVIKRLSASEPEGKPQEILSKVVKNMNVDSFIKVAQMIKEIIDSILTDLADI